MAVEIISLTLVILLIIGWLWEPMRWFAGRKDDCPSWDPQRDNP